MDDKSKKPEALDILDPNSDYVAIYLDRKDIIRAIHTNGIIANGINGNLLKVVKKEPLYKLFKRGDSIIGSMYINEDSYVPEKIFRRTSRRPSVFRVLKYVISRRLDMANALLILRKIYHDTEIKRRKKPIILDFYNSIRINFISILIASLFSSSIIFLTLHLIFPVPHKFIIGPRQWTEFLDLFIPLFSTSMVLVTLYSSIKESRNISQLERQETVRPLLFLSSEDMTARAKYKKNPDLHLGMHTYQVVDLYNNYHTSYFTISNFGLGLASEIKFYLLKRDNLIQIDGIQLHLLQNEGKGALLRFPRELVIDMGSCVSVYKNVYDRIQMSKHDFVIDANNEIIFESNSYVEEGSHFYNLVMNQI